ncbi:MAG TPA: hypothetical protein VF071_04355, partial [Candidatus Limnocylindria bacterium]
ANWRTPRQLVFRQGTHTGYQLDAEGRLTAGKTATLAWDSAAQTSTLRMLPNQSGYWFYVVNGIWAGYWIRHSPVVYLADVLPTAAALSPTTYDPPVPLAFGQGTHTGYQFDPQGRLTAQKTFTLGRSSGADTSQLALVPNQTGSWYLVVNGVWSGYWIRGSDVVYLAG